MLAACAPKVVEVEKIVKETVVVEKVVEKQVQAPQATLLRVGHMWSIDFRGVQEEYDNDWMDAHSDVTIKRSYSTWADHNRLVPTWAAGGEMPDIIYVHGSYSFPWNKDGIMVSLEPYYSTDTEFNVDEIIPESKKLYTYEGEMYEMPYDHGPMILGYNKQMFDEAGVAYPDDTWTQADLMETAIKLTDPDNSKWGWSADLLPGFRAENAEPMLGPWGGTMFNEEETKLLLDTPEAKEALGWWVSNIVENRIAPSPAESQTYPMGPWYTGRCAMNVVATWNVIRLYTFAEFDYDVAPWPPGPVAQRTGSFGSGYGITRDSEIRDVCWSYLREYHSAAGMERLWCRTGRGLSPRPSVFQAFKECPYVPEHTEYWFDAIQNYAVTGHPWKLATWGEVETILNRHLQLMVLGETTLDEGLDAMMAETAPLLG